MSLTLADRLNAARRALFVGRDEERALYTSAVHAAELPFYVLYLFGPGGIGKTSLIREFENIGKTAGIQTTCIDTRHFEPTKEGFTKALTDALDGSGSPDVLSPFYTSSKRQVLIIDTYEGLAHLDDWFREVFLPQLSAETLVVIASRTPAASLWSADPGWQALVRVIPLRNLNRKATVEYLQKRNVPASQFEDVLQLTYGHPLALSLFADSFAQNDTPYRPVTSPDVVKTLLTRLVSEAPSPDHRRALEACALVRVTTEAVLTAILEIPDAHPLFNWLYALSFIDPRPGGLYPNDLARQALISELRWRNPDQYSAFHRRAREYYTERLHRTSGVEQQRLLFDLIYLHRDNPVVAPFYDWQSTGGMITDSLRPEDTGPLLEMAAAHEGRDSVRYLTHWLEYSPEGTRVFRDASGIPLGFLQMVFLERAAPENLDQDPGTRSAWAYLQSHAPLRPGERATHFRFWMAGDSYQQVAPIQSLIFVNIVRHYLITQGLAYTFFPVHEAEFWAPMSAYVNLVAHPELAFESDGHTYTVFGHDWRVEPPAAWLGLLAARETAMAQVSPAKQPAAAAAIVVLSQPEFYEAVRDALKAISQPIHLARNPLTRSRLIADRTHLSTSEAAKAEALQNLIRESAEQLQISPRQLKYYHALHHTYFEPWPSQERAAEALGLPFSTYRRHLKRGIDFITEILWDTEVSGVQQPV